MSPHCCCLPRLASPPTRPSLLPHFLPHPQTRRQEARRTTATAAAGGARTRPSAGTLRCRPRWAPEAALPLRPPPALRQPWACWASGRARITTPQTCLATLTWRAGCSRSAPPLPAWPQQQQPPAAARPASMARPPAATRAPVPPAPTTAATAGSGARAWRRSTAPSLAWSTGCCPRARTEGAPLPPAGWGTCCPPSAQLEASHCSVVHSSPPALTFPSSPHHLPITFPSPSHHLQGLQRGIPAVAQRSGAHPPGGGVRHPAQLSAPAWRRRRR